VRDRGLVVAVCVLVALGSLLCAGKESLAEQPAKTPEPGAPASPDRQAARGRAGAPDAGTRAPATRPQPAQPERTQPALREPSNRSPSPRPSHQQPVHQRPVGAPNADPRPSASRPGPAAGGHVDRGTPGQGRPAEPPGRRTAQPHGPSHGPPHAPPESREHGRGLGPRGPVGPDTVRPRPEPVDRGHVSHPSPQRPTTRPATRPEPPRPEVSKGTGRPEGTEPRGQQGGPAGRPNGENVRPGGDTSVEPPKHTKQPPAHDTDVSPNVGSEEGSGATTPGQRLGEKSPVYEGTPAATSEGGLAGVGADHRPDRWPPARSPADHETGLGVRSEAEPSNRPSGIAEGIAGSRSVAVRREGFGDASVAPPDRRVVPSSQAVDAVAVAPSSDGGQRPAGNRARLAPGADPWSTKFLLDPVWDEGGFLVQQEMVLSLQDEARELSAGTPHGKSITQRGPPLRVPSPFSGFGPVMGGASGFGTSSDGNAPLFAVVFSCLFVILLLDGSRVRLAFLRPGTVPRLALERPG
jgi:hypothetical protein